MNKRGAAFFNWLFGIVTILAALGLMGVPLLEDFLGSPYGEVVIALCGLLVFLSSPGSYKLKFVGILTIIAGVVLLAQTFEIGGDVIGFMEPTWIVVGAAILGLVIILFAKSVGHMQVVTQAAP